MTFYLGSFIIISKGRYLMKIKVLDRASMGMDTPLDVLSSYGEVEIYDNTDSEELIKRCVDADVLVLNKVKITREVLRIAKSLRLICVFATGFDNIDVEAARECGVAVCNVPGYSTDSVALVTLATTLSLVMHLREYSEFVESGEYTDSKRANRLTPVYHEVRGMTWGIIGYGNIGRAVGDVARALGARVVAYKRTPDPTVECVDIDTLCRESDIITVHCPLNEGTINLIDKEKISLMKPSVVLVNEARGAVLREDDVAEAVLNGKIAAFGCDVYSSEPFPKNHPYNKIKDKKNVILTPHAAWGAYEARERCINIIAENISSFISGKIKNRVDI